MICLGIGADPVQRGHWLTTHNSFSPQTEMFSPVIAREPQRELSKNSDRLLWADTWVCS